MVDPSGRLRGELKVAEDFFELAENAGPNDVLQGVRNGN
jgi:hypothetical protein